MSVVFDERQRCLKWIDWAWGPGIDPGLTLNRLARATTAIRLGDSFEPPPNLMTEAERSAWDAATPQETQEDR